MEKLYCVVGNPKAEVIYAEAIFADPADILRIDSHLDAMSDTVGGAEPGVEVIEHVYRADTYTWAEALDMFCTEMEEVAKGNE